MNINIPNKKFATGKMEDFKSFLQGRFDKAVKSRDEKADRFEKAYKLYEGALPEAHGNDVAPIVVPTVRSVVDKLHPSMMNIFTENEEQAVVFRPQKTSLTKSVVEAINLKINDIFLRENGGYEVLGNAFTEGLITGDAFIKAYIEEEVFTEELVLEGGWIPAEMAMLLLKDFPDTDQEQVELDVEKMPDPATGEEIEVPVFRAEKIELKRIERKPRIAFIPFNEMFVITDTADIVDSRYLCHRMKKTVGELVEMGFDKDIIDEAARDEVHGRGLSTKKLANDATLENDEPDEDIGYEDPMERETYLYEHYIYTSLFDKKCKAKLYQVYAVDVNKVLEVNEVSRIPFVHGVPEKTPGSFWGAGMADRFGEDQVFMSNILRDYANYSKSLVHPKWLVLKGQYDRASLLNVGRPGAVVEQEQPGAVQPFSPQGSPGDLLNVLQFVQGNTNDSIMNTVGAQVDPASMMNATATAVAVSVHNTEMKDKRIAKSFAYTMIRPLFEMLYQLLREEDLPIDVKEKAPTQDGGVEEVEVQFPGSNLPARSEFYIDVNTANDDAQQVQTLMTAINSIAQLSAVQSSVITPSNLFEMGKRLLRSADINNIEDYLTDPTMNVPSPEEMEAQRAEAAATSQTQRDLANAQIGLAVAQQVDLETKVSELILMNKHKREMEERELLMKMEEIELKKEAVKAKAEYEEVRNDLRETELYLEAKTGQSLGVR